MSIFVVSATDLFVVVTGSSGNYITHDASAQMRPTHPWLSAADAASEVAGSQWKRSAGKSSRPAPTGTRRCLHVYPSVIDY